MLSEYNSPVVFQVVLPFECFPTNFACECQVVFVGSFMNHQIVWFRKPPLTIFTNEFTFNCSHFSSISARVVFSFYLHNGKHLGGSLFSSGLIENQLCVINGEKEEKTSSFITQLLYSGVFFQPNNINYYNSIVWTLFQFIDVNHHFVSIFYILSPMLIKTSVTLVCTLKDLL